MRPPASPLLAAVLAVTALSAAWGCGDNRRGALAFRKRIIDPAFRSEGVTVFDVDRDGHLDLVTEELWYAGPDFAPREIRPPRAWDPLTAYAHCFGAFHRDVDGDGYDDLIAFGPPGEDALWCKNPEGADVHWACAQIAPSASGEMPLLTTLFEPAGSLVMGIEPERVLGWMTPGPAREAPWQMNPLTPPDFPQAARYEHGLGLGDVSGDGRDDILTGSGWLEQPADRAAVPWPWHPVAICPNNCSHMFAFDFDGDGRNDLIGASPHSYGAYWWRQITDAAGQIAFVAHEIDTSLSQNHAARLADLDGDSRPEFITGKRWWAHFDQDPGAREPAVLAVYRWERAGGDGREVAWTRVDLDDDSGIGSQFEVIDVGGDGRLDIVVSNKKGLHLFEQAD
ncbi:MAG TPA: VCBS repeat-containing protein [Kofleriaceae bacterium]|nr:VCBS repeat-containing protein [Kofleriaceae bacterium]